MGGGQRAAGAVEAAVEEEDQIAGLHGVGGHEVTALIILAGGAPGDGMAQLLINVVHQTGAVEGAGAAPAGDVPAAQQALGHGRRGGPQLAGALKISAHQGDVLGGYIAGLHLIPAVAQIGHNVHHHARLQRPHLFAVGAGLGPDVEHIGGNQPPLLLGRSFSPPGPGFSGRGR